MLSIVFPLSTFVPNLERGIKNKTQLYRANQIDKKYNNWLISYSSCVLFFLLLHRLRHLRHPELWCFSHLWCILLTQSVCNPVCVIHSQNNIRVICCSFFLYLHPKKANSKKCSWDLVFFLSRFFLNASIVHYHAYNNGCRYNQSNWNVRYQTHATIIDRYQVA